MTADELATIRSHASDWQGQAQAFVDRDMNAVRANVGGVYISAETIEVEKEQETVIYLRPVPGWALHVESVGSTGIRVISTKQ
jgi:hypothetical protein